jgi:hypothetical protein
MKNSRPLIQANIEVPEYSMWVEGVVTVIGFPDLKHAKSGMSQIMFEALKDNNTDTRDIPAFETFSLTRCSGNLCGSCNPLPYKYPF